MKSTREFPSIIATLFGTHDATLIFIPLICSDKTDFTQKWDIALVNVKPSIKFSKFVSPINLPSCKQEPSYRKFKKKLEVRGQRTKSDLHLSSDHFYAN